MVLTVSAGDSEEALSVLWEQCECWMKPLTESCPVLMAMTFHDGKTNGYIVNL